MTSGRYSYYAGHEPRMNETREARLQTLRQTLTASIARGGEHSAADVDAYLNGKMSKLAAEGY